MISRKWTAFVCLLALVFSSGCSVFKFVLQGYSTGAKAGRALFLGAADVMTLGLWR